MGVTVDEYIPLNARVNHNGTVDVLVDGVDVPGGSGLSMAMVLQLLTRYAGENGKLLMTTTHPNGNVTRDLVSETGEITPFYPEAMGRAGAASAACTLPTDSPEEALLQALKQRGRRIGYTDIAAIEPAAATPPATTRVKMGEGAIPTFDVEADIMKTLAPKSPPRSKLMLMIVAVIITLGVLGGVAVGAWLLFNGGDIHGPLPVSGTSVPGLRLL